MRRFSFIILVLVFWLATCHGPQPPDPVVTPTPTAAQPTPTAFIQMETPIP